MFESGDTPAGNIGAAWITSGARRARNGQTGRRSGRVANQQGNFVGQPRPGDREPIEKLARGRSSVPYPKPGTSRVPFLTQNVRGAPRFRANTEKHAAGIHRMAEGGKLMPALRGAPRTVAVPSGRGKVGNPAGRVRMAGGRGR